MKDSTSSMRAQLKAFTKELKELDEALDPQIVEMRNHLILKLLNDMV